MGLKKNAADLNLWAIAETLCFGVFNFNNH